MRYQRILDVHKETYIAIKNQHGAEAARLSDDTSDKCRI